MSTHKAGQPILLISVHALYKVSIALDISLSMIYSYIHGGKNYGTRIIQA